MDYVFVLEDDPVYQKQIVEALKQIQDSFEIRTFDSLDAFSRLVKSVMTHGALALAKDDAETIRVVLVVTRLEFIGADRLSLLEKTRDFFMRRGVCTPEEPMRFVFTAFDEPDLDLNALKKDIVQNVIFKPFDRLILQQHLQLAMPQVKSGADALSMQKASALVEMLKKVNVESMTELGFTSVSNRPFEPGVVNKYYGPEFISDRHRSVMARLVHCRPNGNDTYQLDFRLFALDPTQITHIRKRVRAKETNGPREVKPPRVENVVEGGKAFVDAIPAQMNFVIVDSNEDEARSLAGTLQRKISGAEVVIFKSRAEFEADLGYADGAAAQILPQGTVTFEADRGLVVTQCAPNDATIWGEPLMGAGLGRFLTKENGQNLGLWLMGKKSTITLPTQANGKYGALKFERENDRLTVRELQGFERSDFLRGFRLVKRPVAAVFVENQGLDIAHPAAFENFLTNLEKDQGRKPPVFLLANREFTDDEERTLAQFVDDVFFQPLDRIYLLQKILFHVPSLKVLEDPVVVNEKKMAHVIRAANPVQIEEISEAVLVMAYYRPIEIHSFREFLLWQPYEIAAPELCGVVHQVDEGADAKSPQKIRFTFFGMRDEQLKAIRLWILNHYIHGKEDKG
ncbi:MAG: hypothetical protein KF767_02930 [Bdellovibrionaceae bacterium]|nr:hypothetical protein [Pseudobdellovibrionaceae bacterium]